nr:hypothetical protein [Nanoarchaeum sp.]
MFDVEEYNIAEQAKLEEIISIEHRLKSLHGFYSGTVEERQWSSWQGRIRELNPVRYKDHATHPGSVYDHSPRKLPLLEMDAQIIDSVASKLDGMDFLQVRTQQYGPNLEYVLIFEYRTKPNETMLNSKLKAGKDATEYSDRYVAELGLDIPEIKFPSSVMDNYKIISVKVRPEIRYGAQGEAPSFNNFNFLLVVYSFEDKKLRKQELVKNVARTDKSAQNARRELEQYE